MATEMGEYLVGAYLKLAFECDVVDYNARPPGGGLKGLGELDLIGFSFGKQTAYLCEVTTHLGGLLIRNAESTIIKVRNKHERQRAFAKEYLKNFEHHFMFWSPVVPRGLTKELEKIDGLELRINAHYTEAVNFLRKRAKEGTSASNNPAFRLLQILEHLRKT
jgi:hypothetical protein